MGNSLILLARNQDGFSTSVFSRNFKRQGKQWIGALGHYPSQAPPQSAGGAICTRPGCGKVSDVSRSGHGSRIP
jgi:hypothetical protein